MKEENPTFLDTAEETGGLNWRTLVALLYAVFIFLPTLIWMSLYSGGAGVAMLAMTFTNIFMISGITAWIGQPLSLKEVALIFMISNVMGTYAGFENMIFAAYYRQSDVALAFGLKQVVPDFYAPPSEQVFLVRSFFDAEWILPFAVLGINVLLGLLGGLALGLLTRKLYIEVENLEFPIQQVRAEFCRTLTEAGRGRLRVFSTITFASSIWGIIVYAVPFVSKAYGRPMTTVPIPWIDFNVYVHQAIPGASFGIGTEITYLAYGLILPVNVVIGLVGGAVTAQVLGNAILVNQGLTGFAEEFVPGMSIALCLQRSQMYFWAMLSMGALISAGLMPIIRHPQYIVNTFKGLAHSAPSPNDPNRRRGSIFYLLTLYLASAIASSFLYLYLAPDTPIWIVPLMAIVFPLVLTLTGGRAIGSTGMQFQIPYLYHTMMLTSGYQGYSGWFAMGALNKSGEGWLKMLKLAQLTGVSVRTLLKTYLVVLPVALVLGFLYTGAIWQVAPIPSDFYPATKIFWPNGAIAQSLWIARPEQLFDVQRIAIGAGVMAVAYVILDLLALPWLGAVGTTMAFAGGLASTLPYQVLLLISYILRRVIVRIKGREWYDGHKLVLVAGIMSGEGLAIVLGVCISLLIKSIWAAPF